MTLEPWNDKTAPVVLRDPPPRVPTPALNAPWVRGERVIVLLDDGVHHWGYVGWSEVRTGADGLRVVEVVVSQDWDEFKYLGRQPAPDRVMVGDARAVWVE